MRLAAAPLGLSRLDQTLRWLPNVAHARGRIHPSTRTARRSATDCRSEALLFGCIKANKQTLLRGATDRRSHYDDTSHGPPPAHPARAPARRAGLTETVRAAAIIRKPVRHVQRIDGGRRGPDARPAAAPGHPDGPATSRWSACSAEAAGARIATEEEEGQEALGRVHELRFETWHAVRARRESTDPVLGV